MNMAVPRFWHSLTSFPKEWASGEKFKDFPETKTKDHILVTIVVTNTIKLPITVEAFVSVLFLQLPALFLAIFGIYSSLHKHGLSWQGLKDSFLASLLAFVPFSLIEIISLLDVLRIHEYYLEFLLVICSGWWTKTLLKNVGCDDRSGKTRLLCIEAAKVFFGSCLQFCFQAVLLFGYTASEKRNPSQFLVLFSCGFMLMQVGIKFLIFRSQAAETDLVISLSNGLLIMNDSKLTGLLFTKEENKTYLEKLRQYVSQKKDHIKRFLLYLPLVATSATFNMGTLILSILVHKFYSVIYICMVFLANVVVGILLPFDIIERVETKYGMKPRCQIELEKLSKEDDRKRMKANKMLRCVYMSWANLFMTTRPVEKLTFSRSVYFLLFHPMHFIINIITLLTIISINPTTVYIVTSVFLIIIGVINTVLLISHVYVLGQQEQQDKQDYVETVTAFSKNQNIGENISKADCELSNE